MRGEETVYLQLGDVGDGLLPVFVDAEGVGQGFCREVGEDTGEEFGLEGELVSFYRGEVLCWWW